MFTMRMAGEGDIETVVRFYQAVEEDSSRLLCKPECLMEPIQRSFLEKSIVQIQLLMGFWNDELIGSVVINHEPHPEFSHVQWQIDAPKEQIGIIHHLAVLPRYQELGLGKQMLVYPSSWARQQGLKALRYDVLKSDIPLQHYVAMSGFHFRGIVMRRLTERRTLPYGMYEKSM